MATVFWDKHSIIHIDYLKKEKTVTAQYYLQLLDRFDAAIQAKRPHLARKKILFHQGKHGHTKQLKRWLNCLNWSTNCFPIRFSPGLAICDYYLFPNLKKWLAAKRFYSNEEVIAEKETVYFEELSADYYKKGIELLETPRNKCIELEGYYVDE